MNQKRLNQILEQRKQGLTYNEISEKIGIPRGTISSMLSVAKKKGIIPYTDDKSSNRRKTRKKSTPQIKQIPIEAVTSPENESFVVIIGKGRSTLNDILSLL